MWSSVSENAKLGQKLHQQVVELGQSSEQTYQRSTFQVFLH